MDGKILSLNEKYKSKTLFDYGSGKMQNYKFNIKIYNWSFFDIYLIILKGRHDLKIRIIENIDEIITKEKIDMVILCLVLCNINDE